MNLLRRLRVANCHTQTSLAKKLGVVPSTVSLWESGVTLPSPKLMKKLARALGLDAMALTKVIEPELTNGCGART